MQEKKEFLLGKPTIYSLLCASMLMYFACSVRADVIDEVFKQRLGASPESVEYVAKLIEDNPDHPRILELRLYHLGQLLGTSREPSHFQELIKQLEQLSEDAGHDNELNFKCKMLIGEILFDHLKQRTAAYQYYKSLENHAALSGNDLAADYRRVELYCHIAKSAIARPVRDFGEVEKYSRLVMAYPYLGMEDRQMYRKFYERYDEAGRYFITAFSRDIKKLNSILIYPSHPFLLKLRQQAIASTIGLNSIKEEVEEIVKPKFTDVQIAPAAVTDQPISPPNNTPEANQGNAVAAKEVDLPEQQRNRFYPIFWGLVIGAITIALVVFAKTRN